MEYKIGKPYLYQDEWYLFPDTILSELDMTDCNSSITGKCENTATLDECIGLCKESSLECHSGYFIGTPDGNNICVPIHKHPGGPGIGPYDRLRNKSIYPVMNNMRKVTTFVNKIYPFPPDLPNVIFYKDKFTLQIGKLFIGASSDFTMLQMDSDPLYLQFLPQKIVRSYVVKYTPIFNGDEVAINIPHTAIILRQDGDKLSWVTAGGADNPPENTFRIFSRSKKQGEKLTYGDDLYLMANNQPVVYDSEIGTIKLSLENSEPSLITAVPKIQSYYCDGGVCKGVNLEDTKREGETATYNGKRVFRTPSCWSTCSSDTDKGSNRWIFFIFLLIVILFLVILKFAVFR